MLLQTRSSKIENERTTPPMRWSDQVKRVDRQDVAQARERDGLTIQNYRASVVVATPRSAQRANAEHEEIEPAGAAGSVPTPFSNRRPRRWSRQHRVIQIRATQPSEPQPFSPI